MIKVDLHIHTSPAHYEKQTEFCMETLKLYVNELNLDVIAITNHNHFDIKQFSAISEMIDCVVLPGVEIDIEGGHLILITPLESINELEIGCSRLIHQIVDQNSTISFEKFVEFFPNYKNYMLIPHLDKKPYIKEKTLAKFGNDIKFGEVRSAKKFYTYKKNESNYAPVLFSDVRISTNLDKDDFINRYTFVDIKEFDFFVLKAALSDRDKLFITDGKESLSFPFLKDGSIASTKLNVIIGGRSTGKTFTLNNIYKTRDRFENNIKYIKQFSLTGSSEEEAFNEIVSKDAEIIKREYMEPFRGLLDKVVELDNPKIDDVEKYVNTLKEFARQQSRKDAYSKTSLFSETTYDKRISQELIDLINSVTKLLSSSKYSHIIQKYIKSEDLVKVLEELLIERSSENLDFRLSGLTDDIIQSIRPILETKSALIPPSDVDLASYFKNTKIIELFDTSVQNIRNNKIIHQSDTQRFKLIVSCASFKNATEVKKNIGTQVSLVDSFKKYDEGYNYLQELINSGIDKRDLYKCFINFDVKVINDNDNELSGGERAEYNLIREITKANEFDILLLDEPEASFDNKFLNENIIDLIKDISSKTTVFLTTHNNTLGAMLKPDRLIYTELKDGEFNVYSSEFGSKKMRTKKGLSLDTYDIIMDSLEAGEVAYRERESIYENIKN